MQRNTMSPNTGWNRSHTRIVKNEARLAEEFDSGVHRGLALKALREETGLSLTLNDLAEPGPFLSLDPSQDSLRTPYTGPLGLLDPRGYWCSEKGEYLPRDKTVLSGGDAGSGYEDTVAGQEEWLKRHLLTFWDSGYAELFVLPRDFSEDSVREAIDILTKTKSLLKKVLIGQTAKLTDAAAMRKISNIRGLKGSYSVITTESPETVIKHLILMIEERLATPHMRNLQRSRKEKGWGVTTGNRPTSHRRRGNPRTEYQRRAFVRRLLTVRSMSDSSGGTTWLKDPTNCPGLEPRLWTRADYLSRREEEYIDRVLDARRNQYFEKNALLRHKDVALILMALESEEPKWSGQLNERTFEDYLGWLEQSVKEDWRDLIRRGFDMHLGFPPDPEEE